MQPIFETLFPLAIAHLWELQAGIILKKSFLILRGTDKKGAFPAV